MKHLIAPMLATASFATVLVCGLSAASSLTAPYQPHHFKHIDASIWSDTPVQVDQGTQTFDRLAAVTPAEPPRQTFVIRDPVDAQANTVDEPDASMDKQAFNISACQQRYRSYRADDNSYKPFDGGPRRQCDIGANPAPVAIVKAAPQSDNVADNSTSDHGAWCSSRYSSYNPSDNSYQPFGGGARRECVSPVTLASNG